MIFTGMLCLCNDYDQMVQLLPNFTVINIGENLPEYERMGVIGGELFMPNIDSINHLLDGDMNIFNEIYYRYLATTPEVENLFAYIIKGLCTGMKIMLYISKDEFETGYAFSLCAYIQSIYGISVAFNSPQQQIPFLYNNNFDHIICDLLFRYDLINVQELMMLFPPKIHFSPLVTRKLLNEFPININGAKTLAEIEICYFNYKERIKNAGRFLTPLLTKGD